MRAGDDGGAAETPIDLYHSNASYYMDAFVVADNVIINPRSVHGMYLDRVRFSRFTNNIIKDGTYTLCLLDQVNPDPARKYKLDQLIPFKGKKKIAVEIETGNSEAIKNIQKNIWLEINDIITDKSLAYNNGKSYHFSVWFPLDYFLDKDFKSSLGSGLACPSSGFP